MMSAVSDVLSNEWVGERRGPQKWVARRGGQIICRFKTKRELERFFDALRDVRFLLDGDPAWLADQPHPKIPNSNLTARDYAVWLLDHAASFSGMLRAFRLVIGPPARPRYTDNVIPFPAARREA